MKVKLKLKDTDADLVAWSCCQKSGGVEQRNWVPMKELVQLSCRFCDKDLWAFNLAIEVLSQVMPRDEIKMILECQAGVSKIAKGENMARQSKVWNVLLQRTMKARTRSWYNYLGRLRHIIPYLYQMIEAARARGNLSSHRHVIVSQFVPADQDRFKNEIAQRRHKLGIETRWPNVSPDQLVVCRLPGAFQWCV